MDDLVIDVGPVCWPSSCLTPAGGPTSTERCRLVSTIGGATTHTEGQDVLESHRVNVSLSGPTSTRCTKRIPI